MPNMWSFSTAMCQLEHTTPTDLPRVGDRPPRCFLPLPPAISAPSDASQPTHVYGFAVPEDLLADIAHAAKPRARMDGVAATYAGLALVRTRTGAKGAFLAAGRPQPHSSCPRQPTTRYDRHDINEDAQVEVNAVVPLVGVCTSAMGSYRRRPSQDVVDRLAELLGKQPRWWEVYRPRKGERLEDVVCAVVP